MASDSVWISGLCTELPRPEGVLACPPPWHRRPGRPASGTPALRRLLTLPSIPLSPPSFNRAAKMLFSAFPPHCNFCIILFMERKSFDLSFIHFLPPLISKCTKSKIWASSGIQGAKSAQRSVKTSLSQRQITGKNTYWLKVHLNFKFCRNPVMKNANLWLVSWGTLIMMLAWPAAPSGTSHPLLDIINGVLQCFHC